MSNENFSEQQIGYVDSVATWSTRYLDPLGYECLLSLEGENGSEVLKKAISALAHLIENDCQPLLSNNHDGHVTNQQQKPNGTVMVTPSGNSKNPTCPIHNIEMTLWQKNGRSWYSHRWEGGWCYGKTNPK